MTALNAGRVRRHTAMAEARQGAILTHLVRTGACVNAFGLRRVLGHSVNTLAADLASLEAAGKLTSEIRGESTYRSVYYRAC